MNRTRWTRRFLVLALVTPLSCALAGCATPSARKQESLAEQISDAKTRADHLRLAAWYEDSGRTARRQAEIHRQALQEYQRAAYSSLDAAGHHIATESFKQRCLDAIRANEQAEANDLSLAQLHHDLAAAIPEGK